MEVYTYEAEYDTLLSDGCRKHVHGIMGVFKNKADVIKSVMPHAYQEGMTEQILLKALNDSSDGIGVMVRLHPITIDGKVAYSVYATITKHVLIE